MAGGGSRPWGAGGGGSGGGTRPFGGGGSAGSRPFGGGGGPAKKKEDSPHIGPIPLLHFGHLPSWTGEALAPAVWAGEKAGIVPHALARIPYVLEQAIPQAAAHPVKTSEGFAKSLKGVAELPYALVRAAEHKARTDPLGAALLVQGLATNAPGLVASKLATHPKGTVAKAKQLSGALVAATVQDYKTRYGPDWKKYAEAEPFANALDALTFLGTGARAGALAGAANRLDPETARIATLLKNPKAVWKESGNFDPRVLEYETPEGTTISSTQPTSRSPLRAGVQKGMIDPISNRFPDAPSIGSLARITRAQSQQIGRTVSRALGSVPGIDAVGRLRGGESDRVFWGSQLGDYSAGALRQLRDAVVNHYDEPLPGENAAFVEHLHRAKQAGFGPGMVRTIDNAIAHAEKYPEIASGSKMDHAIKAMEHLTRMTEETLLDNAGFSGIDQEIAAHERALSLAGENPDAVAKIEDQITKLHDARTAMHDAHMQMFEKRRGLLPDFVKANTHVDSPVRTAWREALLRQWKNPAQVDAAIKMNDYIAVHSRPENPASWWADKYGMPSEETAKEFVQRVEALSPEERTHLYQYSFEPFGGEQAGRYVSPLTAAVEKMPPKMQVGQLRKYLAKEGVSDQEMLHTGVLDWLALPDEQGITQRASSDVVTKAELEQVIRSPENALNLAEHHWVNTGVDAPPFLEATRGAINSRVAMPGEYHHLAVGLRDIVPEHYGEELFGNRAGSGFLHHGDRSNVIAHVRYHIFHDERNGKTTMLVEEVQSDWASDFRRETREHGPYKRTKPLSMEEQRHLDDLRNERAYLNNEIEVAAQSTEGIQTQGDLEGRLHEVESEIDQLGRLPDSPLGPKRYLNTLASRIAQEAHASGVERIVIADGPTQTVRNVQRQLAGEVPWDASNEEIARWADREGAFKAIYEKDFPKALAKATGETPRHVKGAYTGMFRNAYAHMHWSEQGDMSGTVIDLGKEAHANAEKTRALYQSAERGKLPRGATEFLRDGRSAVRMFKDADLSTWVHELSHVALSDLPAEDVAVLEKHFGSGAKVEHWTNDMHEEYARSFERYMATGRAPTRALEPVFSKIANWMARLWKTTKEDIPDIHPEVRQAFDSMFSDRTHPTVFMPHRPFEVSLSGSRTTRGMPRARRDVGDQVLGEAASFRKNRLSLLRSGMLNTDPRALMEHSNRVMMLARANQLREAVVALSRPLHIGETPNLETQYVVKRAGRGVDKPFYDALENAKDAEVSQRIAAHIDENITSNPEIVQQWEKELADDPTGRLSLGVVDKTTVDHLYKNVTGKTPGATTRPGNTATKLLDATLDSVRGMLLYANPGFYVANMAGNSLMMMMADPRSARYLPWAMKEAMKGVGGRGDRADPLWHRIAVEMGRGPTSGGLSERRPVLLGQGRRVEGGLFEPAAIRERAGRVAHTLTSEKRAIPARAAGNVSHFWGSAGRGSGRIIDDSFRVAAWRQTAAKLGYSSDKAVHRLLDEAVRDSHDGMLSAHSKALRDLNTIRDQAEQLMLDFDSMTPFEKTYMTRALFLYPFTKAAVKYPFMYAGERPIAGGLLGQAGLESGQFSDQVLGPADPNLPRWMRDYARTPWGYLPVSSVSSFQPLSQLLASGANIGGEQQLGIQSPIEYANPFVQLLIDMARQQNKFGKAQKPMKTLGQEFPAPAYIKELFGKKPGKIYSDRDFLSTLERAFRGPVQIDPAVAQQEAYLANQGH